MRARYSSKKARETSTTCFSMINSWSTFFRRRAFTVNRAWDGILISMPSTGAADATFFAQGSDMLGESPAFLLFPTTASRISESFKTIIMNGGLMWLIDTDAPVNFRRIVAVSTFFSNKFGNARYAL